MKEVVTALYQRFNASVHGEYSPGRVVNILTAQSASHTTYTEQHERLHEQFTMTTSLGSIAICLELFFLRRPELANTPGFSDAFLRRYVEDTRAVHEGFAVALGLFCARQLNGTAFPTEATVRTLHPAFELTVAEQILGWADRAMGMVNAVQELVEPFAEHQQLGNFMFQLELLSALGRLVLSPFVPHTAADTAIRGVNRELDAGLSAVWDRLQRALRSDPRRVAIEMLEFAAEGGQVREVANELVSMSKAGDQKQMALKRARLRQVLQAGLRVHLALDYSPPFDIDYIFGRWLPDFTGEFDALESHPPPGWDRYAEMCGVHYPLPKSDEATGELVLDVCERKPVPTQRTCFLVAEYAVHMIGRQTDEYAKILLAGFTGSGRQKLRLFGPGFQLVLGLYEFDERGEHLGTTYVHEPPAAYLREIPNRGGLVYPALPGGEAPCGIVVSTDDLITSSRLRLNLVGLELCVVAKRLVPPEQFAAATVLGTAHGATLCRIEGPAGQRVWSLVAPGLRTNTDVLDPATAAYAWVLRNGMIAIEKWTMFGIRQENNDVL